MSRIAVPVTWRDPAEHRRLIASRLNEMNSSSYDEVETYTDLTTGSPSTVSFIPPDWANNFAISIIGLSLSGTDDLDLRLGDSAGVKTSGYIAGFAGAATFGGDTTAEIGIAVMAGATRTYIGTIFGLLVDRNTNTWFVSSIGYRTGGSSSIFDGAGYISLSGTLTTIQLKSSGTDTFDAGSAAMRYL